MKSQRVSPNVDSEKVCGLLLRPKGGFLPSTLRSKGPRMGDTLGLVEI